MPLLLGPLPWLVLRAVVGFGCAGLFITTESWLNAKAEPAERGRIFSIYMAGTFLALALGHGPLRRCLRSEDPQGRSVDQVALKVESVVDRGLHVQETLGGFGRFEALQLALSPSYHLMRILCPIVLSQLLFVRAGQP